RRGRVHAPAPERGERPRLRECVDRGHRWDHRERHGDAGDQRGGHRRRRFWRREPRRLVRAGEQRGERDRLDRQRSRLRFGVADASSNVTTSTSVGTGLDTESTRTGDLTVGSHGINATVAASTAGSGGVVAGNGSIADADDDSSSSTTIGATAHTLYANDVTI